MGAFSSKRVVPLRQPCWPSAPRIQASASISLSTTVGT